MRALWFIVLIISILFAVTAIAADDATNYTGLCRHFKNNTIVSVPGSCDKYIKCIVGGQHEVYSCDSGDTFDVKTQRCVAGLDSCTMVNRCAGKTNVWVANPTNCNGYYYCENGEAFASHCDDTFNFDEASEMCVYATDSICVDVSSMCELVPDKTKFRDETDCASYYECASKKQSKKSCSKKYFDVETQACVEKNDITCNAHPYPSNVCGTASKPKKGVFVADGATCRGYFYCADLGSVPDIQPTWGQCPEGKFFSATTQLCSNPVDVKCSYNRCEGRGNMMVSSAKNNCHNYLICENGFVREERTCPRDYFFDEFYQACVPDIIYYECCDIK